MIDSLNKLLRINLDAASGYEYAAENIKNDSFRIFLDSYSKRRHGYAHDIGNKIAEMGGDPELSPTLLGEAHQAFMKIRESVSSGSDHDSALLVECVRGEGEALHQYEKVLKLNNLKPELRRMITTQFDKIRAAQSTMAELGRVV